MTLSQEPGIGTDAMNRTPAKDDVDKSSRPVRSRRYTRRSFVAGQRPQKRLFTPEIKRYLKDWLVRRRENPYPNRDEKKLLARDTGLTYVQICNWFANWRRKLKNVNLDRNQQTWGHLIRSYNDQAQGNVEQFSICSEDSIWSEPEPMSPSNDMEHSGSSESCHLSEEFPDSSDISVRSKDSGINYSEDQCESPQKESKTETSPLLLSKWLESAARFQPSETNYSWWAEGKRNKPKPKIQSTISVTAWSKHDRDEVEAAMALTTLATASCQLRAS